MRLIDADALIQRYKDFIEFFRQLDDNCLEFENYNKYAKETFEAIIGDIKNAPTIDVEPIRHGRWTLDVGIGLYCSECGIDIGNDFDWLEFVHYCPNCGAKMDGDEE